MAGVGSEAERPAALRVALAELKRRVKGPRRGRVFALSAPSGAGKDAVLAQLRAESFPLYFMVHATTRSPRPGEVDGTDYHFVTKTEFLRRRDLGAFLESAMYLEHYYGTLREPVDRALAQGQDVLLKPDVQGAMQVRAQYPDAVLIFLAPPHSEELGSRLYGRGTESAAEQERRLHRALAELPAIPQYDYLVINRHGRLDETVALVKAIVLAEQQRVMGLPPVPLAGPGGAEAEQSDPG